MRGHPVPGPERRSLRDVGVIAPFCDNPLGDVGEGTNLLLMEKGIGPRINVSSPVARPC